MIFGRARATATAMFGGLILSIAGCSDLPGPDGTNLGEQLQFSEEIDLQQFEDLLSNRVRVEIRLGDGLVASRVEVRNNGDAEEDEQISAPVSAAEISGNAGVITLDVRDLTIDFDENTKFGDDEEGASADDFVTQINNILSENETPTIRAVRSPPDTPQAPDNGSFLAAHIALTEEPDNPELEVNVDADNLRVNDAPPPDAWVDVLGLPIELRVSDGRTELIEERDIEKERFEGIVQSVNLDRQSVTLENGTVVRLVEASEIHYRPGDRHRLGSLADVAAAIEAGEIVVTAGVGMVESREPLTLAAIEVVFELDEPAIEHFNGYVADVDLETRTVTLEDGTVIRVDDEVAPVVAFDFGDHLLTSLEAVKEAIDNEQSVLAAGVGEVESEEPLTLVALKVVFVILPRDATLFHGEVTSINLEAQTFTLKEGPTVQITDESSVWVRGGDVDRLSSLEAVAEALEAEQTVFAAGIGREVEESDLLVALKVLFYIKGLELEDFDGIVASVDLENSMFTLQSGTVVAIDENTVIWYEESDDHRLGSLEAVHQALEEGRTVLAAGIGTVEGEIIHATKVAFIVDLPEIVVPIDDGVFLGTVEEVDLENQSFTLDNGVVVRLTDESVIVFSADSEGVMNSLEDVVEALNDEKKVVAAGAGELEGADPVTIAAAAVVFIT